MRISKTDMNIIRKSARLLLTPFALFILLMPVVSKGQDATWDSNPVDSDWSNASNWTPQAVPYDTATFNVSSQSQVNVSTFLTNINTFLFPAGAGAFTITSLPGGSLLFAGAGVLNHSIATQNLVVANSEDGTAGEIDFIRHASIRGAVLLTAQGGNSTGFQFRQTSSAGDASIQNQGSALPDVDGGSTGFFEYSSPDQSTITNMGGEATNAPGGATYLENNVRGGKAQITANGGAVDGSKGGLIVIQDEAAAQNTTLTANSGANGGGGGLIEFADASTGDEARVMVFGNGTLDISEHNQTPLAIGSLEGNGIVLMGTREMQIGDNNVSTVFSGKIEGTGSLTKIGSGHLTLASGNTYTGGTTLNGGTLVVTNPNGSATGKGNVAVQGGILGGNGALAGALTVGTGSGSGAFLAPAGGTSKPATLTIQKAVTFNSDATYTCILQASKKKSANDEVVANGVTINGGAQFNLLAKVQGKLKVGTVFTVISNTASTPISGTFANLADGATITVGNTKLQASYEGGDGNDLTLTVVP
jgi:autotransporter-associated beta strand protein